MSTDSLPAPRTRSASPTRAAVAGQVNRVRVIDLQPLRVTDEGWIRHVEFMHLPGNRVTLNGPLNEVRQITRLLRRSGELLRAGDPAPSLAGILVTLTLAAAPGSGRVVPARRLPTVAPWTGRRKTVVFGGVIPAVLVAGLVLALLWPLPTVLVSAALLALAVSLQRSRIRRDRNSNVPHVAIHHVDQAI